MTSCSSISVNKSPDQRSKSCDTVCSSNSGCFLQKRKPIHPLAASVRATFSHTSSKNSNVRQRVLSAKLLKLRSLQSQLNDANYHLNEMQRENLTLKTLNQRQEKALAKYEGTNADLPRLLRSHSEEIRVLTEKNKSLRKAVKDLTDLVKARDDELLNVKKQLEHLEKLNRNKHLGERQKLSDQVDDLKQKLESADNQISTLNRKLLLEGKSSKQRLLVENVKHRECQKNLMQALAEIERLTGLVDVNNVNANKKEDKLPLRKKLPERDSKSLITIDDKLNIPLTDRRSDESLIKELPNGIVEKLKVLPTNVRSEETYLLDTNGELISPTETIKNRLSTEKRVTYESGKLHTDVERPKCGIRPNSSQKLESLSNNIDSIIQRSRENGLSQFDRTLGDYCNQVMNTVKNCSKVVEDHQESLDQSRNDTETIKDAVDEIKALDDQLKRNSIFSIDAAELKKLLKPDKEEKNSKHHKSKDSDRNRNVKLREDPKAKLLATLRAIDNGEFIDSFENDITNSRDEIYDSFAN
ncbi:laminin subunit alpha-2 [Coccinella septempunctata]|uniref:laminin subunit alpha-2 n=1 Tax=Coccinella septempunctata TaxID=41139 RepID=UPI001D05E856|nr:laminin subunit alpha-2 [Coccinella septempunctata]